MSAEVPHQRQTRIEADLNELDQLEALNHGMIRVERAGSEKVLLHILNIRNCPVREQGFICARPNHRLEITFPQDYPLSPPNLLIQPPVLVHPNVTQQGHIQMSEFAEWNPAIPISALAEKVWEIFTLQFVDPALIADKEAERLFRNPKNTAPRSDKKLTLPEGPAPETATPAMVEGETAPPAEDAAPVEEQVAPEETRVEETAPATSEEPAMQVEQQAQHVEMAAEPSAGASVETGVAEEPMLPAEQLPIEHTLPVPDEGVESIPTGVAEEPMLPAEQLPIEHTLPVPDEGAVLPPYEEPVPAVEMLPTESALPMHEEHTSVASPEESISPLEMQVAEPVFSTPFTGSEEALIEEQVENAEMPAVEPEVFSSQESESAVHHEAWATSALIEADASPPAPELGIPLPTPEEQAASVSDAPAPEMFPAMPEVVEQISPPEEQMLPAMLEAAETPLPAIEERGFGSASAVEEQIASAEMPALEPGREFIEEHPSSALMDEQVISAETHAAEIVSGASARTEPLPPLEEQPRSDEIAVSDSFIPPFEEEQPPALPEEHISTMEVEDTESSPSRDVMGTASSSIGIGNGGRTPMQPEKVARGQSRRQVRAPGATEKPAVSRAGPQPKKNPTTTPRGTKRAANATRKKNEGKQEQ